MRMPRWIPMLAAALLLVVAAGRARADQQGARELAKQHFASGEAKYKAGDYQGAIIDFLAADALVPSPILAFNQALCHEKLGQDADAVRLYRDYLTRRPDAPNRAVVEQRIGALEAAIAARNAPPPAPAPTPTPPEPAPPPQLDDIAPEPAPPPPVAAAPRRPYDDPLARRVPGGAVAGTAYPDPGAPTPAAPAPVPAPDQPQKPKPVYKQWWFWVVVGVSAIVMIQIASGPESSSGSSAPVLLRF